MEDNFKKFILRYLQLHPELQIDADKDDPDDLIDNDAINDSDAIEDLEITTNNPYTKISIKYYPTSEHYYSDPYQAEITFKKYPDFLEFLQNPDLYAHTKKFNL